MESTREASCGSHAKRFFVPSEAGIFYYVNTVTGEKQAGSESLPELARLGRAFLPLPAQVEPPPPWERKQSRRDASISYYWTGCVKHRPMP